MLYRGYPIEQLAQRSEFLETCYLLLFGELPSPGETERFRGAVIRHTMLHEQLSYFYRGFRRDAHPMAIMVGVVGALSAFYPRQHRHHRSRPAPRRLDPLDRQDADDRRAGL